jgi:integrase
VRFDDAAGKERTLTATCRTRKDADAKRRELVARKESGVALGTGKQTLEEYAAGWVASCRAAGLSPLTVQHYEDHFRRYITPLIGNVPLERLRPAHVQLVLTSLSERKHHRTGEPLSARTRLHVFRVLHNALERAADLDLIAGNPAERVKAPSVKRERVAALSVEDITALLQACSVESDALGIAARLAVTCGMRRGELCGLRWSDVDLEAGVLSVQQTVVPAKGGLVVKPPKSDDSLRTIPLPARTVSELKAYKSRQVARRLALGPVWTDRDLVIDNGLGGYYYPDGLSQAFTVVARKLKIPATMHTMRHQYASLLVASGENVKVVQYLLGHSSAQLTMDTYSHLLPGAHMGAAAKINAALEVAAGG